MVRPQVSDNICVRCKGARLLCGKAKCPILVKYSILKSTLSVDPGKFRGKQDIFGASPPAVFVGHVGYPYVNIGPLIPIGNFSAQKDTRYLDSPESWFGKDINEIIAFRSGLVRSNFKMNIKYNLPLMELEKELPRTNLKLLKATQELTLASNSVDTEAKLNRVRVGMLYGTHSPPQGPSGRAEKIEIVDNVKVLKPVDKAVSDTDLKAADAIEEYLYRAEDLSITSIQRIFSAGLLGVKQNRRLVPTRWSITAVDDIIGKYLKTKLQHFPSIDKYYSFFGEYLDNKFVIIFMPGPWAYEMNECWNQSSIWNQKVEGILPPVQTTKPVIVTDYEFEKGRTKYAGNVTGAYYAARKEIEEFLYNSRRQARVIVFREVSGGYIVPLGVWVIRETVKQALAQRWKGPNVKIHETLDSALSRVASKLSIPLEYWTHSSQLLPYIKKQRRLDFWLRRL
ncbi:MAG: Nre family DNA repair protein [Promethearchaeota archaeon]